MLVSKLITHIGSDKPINFHYTFRAVTFDIITSYCLGESAGCLDIPDFKHPLITNIGVQLQELWKLKWIPAVRKLIMSLPDAVVFALVPLLRPNLEMKQALTEQINDLTRNPEKLREVDHDLIYTHLIQAGEATGQKPSKLSLLNEVWSSP